MGYNRSGAEKISSRYREMTFKRLRGYKLPQIALSMVFFIQETKKPMESASTDIMNHRLTHGNISTSHLPRYMQTWKNTSWLFI